MALFGLILAAAGVLRFWGLTQRPMWIDEVCTWYCVRNWDAWPADGPDRDREVTHRAYLLLVRAWTRLVGNDAAGLRSFSAVSGLLAVAAIGGVGALVGGRRLSAIVMTLAAVHPLHIHYSQEARSYALWTLEMTILLGVLWALAKRPRWWLWLLYVGLSLAAFKTHDYTVFWWPATALTVVVAGDRGRFVRGWLIAHAVLAALIAPTLWTFVGTQVEGGSKAWIREVWAVYPPWAAIPRTIWALLPSGAYPFYLGPLGAGTDPSRSPLPGSVATVARYGSVVLALVATGLWFRGRARKELNGAVAWLAGVTFAFLVVAFLFSCTVYPSYVVGRYDLAAWPTMVVLLGAMTVEPRNYPVARVRFLTVAALFVTMSCLTLAGRARAVGGDDVPERAKRMAQHVQPDDLVVSVSLYKWFMLYEWDRIGFAPRSLSYLPEHERQLGWRDAEAELKRSGAVEAAASGVAERVDGELQGGGRVWVIAHGSTSGARWEVDRRLFAALQARGIDTIPVDEWLGLARLARRP